MAHGQQRPLWQRIIDARYCYLALLPTAAFLLVFSYYPPVLALYRSLFAWDGARAFFIGLQNFGELLGDRIFLQSVGNVMRLSLFRLLAINAMSLLVAEILFNLRNDRLRYVYQIAFLVPMVVPNIVLLLLWQFVYDGQFGLLNAVLGRVGLEFLQRAWLGDSATALASLMFLGFPWIVGTTTLIYLAGLQSIPVSVIECATLEGCSLIRRFVSIDLPMILGQVRLLFILTLIGEIQAYETQFVLTNGGPGTATMVPGLHMFQVAFNYGRLGYACAIGLVLFLVTFILTFINLRYIRPEMESR